MVIICVDKFQIVFAAQMEVTMNKKRKKPDGEKIFSIVASLAIVIALVAGIISIVRSNTRQDKKKNYIDLNVAEKETTTEHKEPQTTVERVTEKIVEIETTTEDTKQVDAPVINEDNTEAVNGITYSFNENSVIKWPLKGDIVLGFNMDNTIYFPTLDVYRCNPAIMINATEGEDVRSGVKGVVTQVYSDNETGTTMKILAGDGYEITYGQLKDIAVGIGDNLDENTVIGKVAAPTKYYTKEGSNLYMMLTKDGMALDPMLFLEEEQ